MCKNAFKRARDYLHFAIHQFDSYMEILTIITALIFISTAFSYLNQRLIKLPSTIGVMVIAIVVSHTIFIDKIEHFPNRKSFYPTDQV